MNILSQGVYKPTFKGTITISNNLKPTDPLYQRIIFTSNVDQDNFDIAVSLSNKDTATLGRNISFNDPAFKNKDGVCIRNIGWVATNSTKDTLIIQSFGVRGVSLEKTISRDSILGERFKGYFDELAQFIDNVVVNSKNR